MDPGIGSEASPPRMPGNQLQKRPFVSSILVAILAGLLLQMTKIIDFPGLIQSTLTDDFVQVRLLDIGFRMTMGAVLVLVAVPVLMGYYRTGWLREYLSLVRLTMGPEPARTIAAAFLSILAFLFVLVVFSLGAGVFKYDPSVLTRDNNWLILVAALVPGIWEELTFRGVILSNLQQHLSQRGAVVVSSIVFGLFHFSNLGTWEDFGSVVAGVIAATTLGIGWGYVVIKTRSTVPAIFLHYAIDVFLFDELFIDPSASDDSTTVVYLAIVLVYPILTVLLTMLLFRRNRPAVDLSPPAVSSLGP